MTTAKKAPAGRRGGSPAGEPAHTPSGKDEPALAAEAAGDTKATITFRTLELTYETDSDEWPLVLFRALAFNDLYGILVGAFGPAQVALLEGLDPTPKGGELRDLSRRWSIAQGFTSPGESPASSD